MKNVKPGLLAASCALLAAMALPAQAVYIDDGYVGADSTDDIIGLPANYRITGMEVTRSGSTLTVSIDTDFADNVGSDSSTTQNGKGIGFGDLFLASSWNPVGSAPYYSDDNVFGTKWMYGFSLADRWDATVDGSSLAGTLYELNGATNADNALMSDAFQNATPNFRNGQEVAVKTASSDTVAIGTSGSSSWSVDGPGLKVNFFIDLTGTDLEYSDTIALHWGMTCANDTIEGKITKAAGVVPVPAAVWLFGSGLVGLVSIARRRQRS